MNSKNRRGIVLSIRIVSEYYRELSTGLWKKQIAHKADAIDHWNADMFYGTNGVLGRGAVGGVHFTCLDSGIGQGNCRLEIVVRDLCVPFGITSLDVKRLAIFSRRQCSQVIPRSCFEGHSAGTSCAKM